MIDHLADNILWYIALWTAFTAGFVACAFVVGANRQGDDTDG